MEQRILIAGDSVWIGPARSERHGNPCGGCGVATTPCDSDGEPIEPWEWYVIHDHIWRTVNKGDPFLCIGCLEDRLGRKVTARDFSAALINDVYALDSPRLRDRKIGLATPRRRAAESRIRAWSLKAVNLLRGSST